MGKAKIENGYLADVRNKNKSPIIHIEGCQIKSREKLEIVCRCLDQLEKEIGIRSVNISLANLFVCPDIDLTEFSNSKEPMEALVGRLLIKIDNQIHGKKSKYCRIKP